MMLTPEMAMQRLIDGHQRFMLGQQTSTFSIETATSSENVQRQNPVASVLTCSDSRAIPAFIFDMSFGDIFVVKTAGAIATETQLASLEFAVSQLNCPLIVVMGHTSCGAIGATISHLLGDSPTSPNLYHLVEHIANLIDDKTRDSTEAVKRATIATSQRLSHHSSILAEAVNAGTLKIVACLYDLSTGDLLFME